MDVDSAGAALQSNMDIDTHGTATTGMDIGYRSMVAAISFMSPICAAQERTKSTVKSKFKKRLGAKTPKRLELADNAQHNISQDDATTYRALSARCNYLSQDRPNISFSSKELCRELSVPTAKSYRKLKRLVRYLCGMPRLVYNYKFQEAPTEVDIYVDTDFAGCKETRRSISGGIVSIGGCCVKHWAKTQTTISLSSGEAELHGIAYGTAQAIGIQSLCTDMGWQAPQNTSTFQRNRCNRDRS